MHRRVVPPAPDLFGHEGQERGEQALQDRERDGERRARRLRRGGVGAAVGADLDQFDVVVAERPEERLGALEGARVVVVLEVVGGLG